MSNAGAPHARQRSAIGPSSARPTLTRRLPGRSVVGRSVRVAHDRLQPASNRGRKSMPTARRILLAYTFFLVLGFASSVASAAGEPASLADALKIIQSKQYVDLTHSFSPTSPVW